MKNVHSETVHMFTMLVKCSQCSKCSNVQNVHNASKTAENFKGVIFIMKVLP